ncbi:unnamed protein product, partial [Hymenolepis diminuta]|uniref:EGF-like domain-containing protein n=1 Tax=Hymenolepis diminuta TaxID=6216 RepID=A0A158QDH4_HYMDI
SELFKTIVSHVTPTYENTRQIRSVYLSRGELASLPEELDFTIEVNDIDANGKILIDEFYYKFFVNSTMDQKVRLGENIKITLNFKLYCLKGFYGSRCEVQCVPDLPYWECDPETGARVCLLQCNHGNCVASESGKPICECFEGYFGQLCDVNRTSAAIVGDRNDIAIVIEATLIPLSLLGGTAILIFVFCHRRRAKPLSVSNDNYTDPDNCQRSPISFNTLEKNEDTIRGRVFRPIGASQRNKFPPTPTECETLDNMEDNSIYEDPDNDVYLEPSMTSEYSQLPLPPLPRS